MSVVFYLRCMCGYGFVALRRVVFGLRCVVFCVLGVLCGACGCGFEFLAYGFWFLVFLFLDYAFNVLRFCLAFSAWVFGFVV